MTDEIIERIKTEISEKEGDFSFPEEIKGFYFKSIGIPNEDFYDIFSYMNPTIHKGITIYYHAETNEYKMREKIGLIEFCNISYIDEDISELFQKVQDNLPKILEHISVYNHDDLGIIMKQQGIDTWDIADNFPIKLEGYKLFIKPKEPVKITNGSFIILDYVDFGIESDLSIYYNIYREEFFGEARICNVPTVYYDFDSSNLEELELLLKKNLIPKLKSIRREAVSLSQNS